MLNLKTLLLLFFTLPSIAAVQDPRTIAIDSIQKSVYDGKPVALLATSENAVPFLGSAVYRVIDGGNPGRGWLVWVNLNDGSAHTVQNDSLNVMMESLKIPLSHVHLDAQQLAKEAKKISFSLIHLNRSAGKVACSEAKSAVVCTLNSTVKLSFDAKKGKISLVK